MAWRSKGRSLDSRLSSMVGVALVVSGTFVLSGIFSSRVVGGTTSEVLLSGQHCGNMTHMLPSGNSDFEANAWTDYYSAFTQKASEYLNYAFRCYRNENGTVPTVCSLYTQPRLPYSKDTNAACPFNETICVQNEGNLLLDSGYLDSYKHLGLNQGPKFQIRLKRRCAPLLRQGYTQADTNTSNPKMMYYYGATVSANKTRPYTLALRVSGGRLIESEDLSLGDDYTITSISSFERIPQLSGTNAMVTLLFLESVNVKYYAKVPDPWFSAEVPKEIPAWVGLGLPNNTYYAADEIAGVLGCTSNMFICNPNLPDQDHCWDPYANSTTLIESKIFPDAGDQAFINAYQQYFMQMFSGTVHTPSAYYMIKGLPSLLTRFTLTGLMQPARIPSTRWQEEMEYMFQTNLAATQARMVEHASGSQSGTREAFADCGATYECHRLCYSQKIRSPRFYSFSVLGMAIILVLGSLIIFLGTFTEDLIALASRLPSLAHSRRLTYARQEWHANSVLQLQRQAHEALGQGTWSGTDSTVPVTQGGEKLAPYDISDVKHPRLMGGREMQDLGVGKKGQDGEARPPQMQWGDVPVQTHWDAPRGDGRAKYSRLLSFGPK